MATVLPLELLLSDDMWPWGHLAVGYLCYSAGVRLTNRRIAAVSVVALALGTQFPDLIDKPLAWTVAILPNGRSMAHSLIVAGVVAVVVLALARSLDARSQSARIDTDGGLATGTHRPTAVHVGASFLVGYGSHLLADASHPLLSGEVAALAFLGWPILPPVQYDGPKSFVGHVATMEVTPFFLAEFALLALALIVWHADGRPGVAAIRRSIRR